MAAYYNEFDPKAAAWLRELIRRNLIAPGDVDERSILEVRAADLRGYRQCHFFAGIGGWSYALRLAGWSDERPVWTGSCPCQPFSAAGKREGFADERHLWPVWFGLLAECGPDVVFGEQVSPKRALPWFDLVSTDLESAGYAVGALDTCAAGVGAPHIRQRLYFVADTGGAGANGRFGIEGGAGDALRFESAGGGASSLVADAKHAERRPEHEKYSDARGRHGLGGRGNACELADANETGQREQRSRELSSDGDPSRGREADEPGSQGWGVRLGERAGECAARAPSAVNGFWRDAVWIPCSDGKARATQSGTPPLAHGAPARVVRLRGYGNAIVIEQARAFIEAYMNI
jgi:DNA (cytosine-5)-methyltransferase 1